jgi:hypothetical protein
MLCLWLNLKYFEKSRERWGKKAIMAKYQWYYNWKMHMNWLYHSLYLRLTNFFLELTTQDKKQNMIPDD